MNSAGKLAVLMLLCFVAGCQHKTQATLPPPAPDRVYTPNDVAKAVPEPQLPPAKLRDVRLQGPAVARQEPAPNPPKPRHHKPKPTDAKDTSAQTPTTQQASTGQPPDVSPIGQLSSAGENGGVPNHHEILEQITQTENGLNGIKRTLTADEQVTATQIRTFLAKAKEALDHEDLDGAHTLVTKAKVLLDELTKG
jgi:hypothetical protein